MSATPSQCRQRAPTPVPGECPSPASDCSSEGLCPPRAWGIPSEGGEHHGTPRMPLVPGGCPIFCCSGRNETKDAPSRLGIACARPRVRGTPARARAGRSWRATRTPRRGNARTRARAGPRCAGDAPGPGRPSPVPPGWSQARRGRARSGGSAASRSGRWSPVRRGRAVSTAPPGCAGRGGLPERGAHELQGSAQARGSGLHGVAGGD